MAVVFSFSLYFVNVSHSKITWSVLCSAVPQGHVGSSIILKRCKYAFVFPCPDTLAVNFCVRFIFIFNLSSMFLEIFFRYASFGGLCPVSLPFLHALFF